MTPQAALDRGLAELALPLAPGATEKLLRYVALLEKWNRTYNLTAIRDPLEMVSHHLLDSLAVVPHLPMGPNAALADVGSGAGLPGIPLAIARADWRVTLNDSNQKKTAFLRQAAIELSLGNVEVQFRFAGPAHTWGGALLGGDFARLRSDRGFPRRLPASRRARRCHRRHDGPCSRKGRKRARCSPESPAVARRAAPRSLSDR